MKHDYVDVLKYFQLDRDNVVCWVEDNELKIHIGDGMASWFDTILFEVPVLAIVSETYFADKEVKPLECQDRLDSKIKLLKEQNSDIKFADFGTRRRIAKGWQEHMLRCLKIKLPNNFIGTSNVMFAKKLNIKPIGTMAHEWIQACQALTRLRDSQKYAFQKWADEYRGDLGIALSDTLGMGAFFNDFDMYFAKLFDGARHDSGDPYVWCDKLIKHYESMNIDPMTKTAIFSDGLDFTKALALHKEFKTRIRTSFGIGTNLTNDCGLEPLAIVVKMTKCDGDPVAKISDSPGKAMCNDLDYLKYLRSQFSIRLKRDVTE
ncbi:unnamed protein product [marine sediment metagenome]|uniref:nicotinate phosphoribosyltransferase n=1 Tax=marine sediment metagenome TaxID=412755 RepID=X1HBU5_9ZZZZ